MAAEAAVSFAVETLGKLLIEKAVFLIGVKGEVEWVREELKSMQNFLKDAAKKQSDSDIIRNWISDVRKVAHDAEDAIEMFVLKVQSKKLKKRYGCFPNHLYHLNKVGEEIASIRQKLKDIDDRRKRYDIQKEEASSRSRTQEEIETRRRPAYWKPDQDVVGLEEDVKLLLGKAVFEKSKGLSVAAILGMGGVGKSTLATKIYNHAEVVDRFDCRLWVVVSSEFSAEDILKQILLQLGISSDDLKRLGSIEDKVGRQEEVKKEVHQRLTNKRYFIVLDDVWEAAHWESFTTAFPDGGKGSRLLLTSRNPVITMNSVYVHNMTPLDADESWDLLLRKVFGGNISIERCPDEVKKVGEEILKKCGGLPLAISVVGGLLAKRERSKTQWEKLLKEMNSDLDKYSSSGDLNTITTILELSYRNLPLVLKACFLCLGFFKEDAIIKVKNLVHIWVAQGLVAQEAAPDYLNELIGRNMVQVKEMRYDKVKACHMHDLLRDLCIRKAKEEIDFEVVREEQNSSHQSLAKPRHRAVYCRNARFVFSTNRNQHLRSLFVHQEFLEPVLAVPSSYWKSFELLRHLDIGNATLFMALPEGIGALTGLIYLKINCSDVLHRFPRSWAKLTNLEVLELWSHLTTGWNHLTRGGATGAIKINKDILKMESLRHIYAYVDSPKVGLGNMRKLQTLEMFYLSSASDVWKIQGMSGVSKLGIYMDGYIGETSSLFTCLSSLENLFHLSISRPPRLTSLEGLNSLHRVTRLKLLYGLLPVYFPPNLSYLTLFGTQLDEESMPILEKLPKLIHLKLQHVTCDRTMVITSGGFHSLKVLYIQKIMQSNLTTCKMKIEESAMPELNQFIIRECLDLDVENLPERIKSALVQPH